MVRWRQGRLFPPDGEAPPRARIILCVDLNQFYVAVERRRNPALVGKPVVIGSDPKEGRGRGVVAAASYEARALGVRSGMPISWAWREAPQAVYLRPDMEAYAAASDRVMERLRRRAPRFEPASIDEAYLDVTDAGDFDRARELAADIQRELREGEGLDCSIGVAPNKLVAKIASDFKKPAGLTVVRPGEERAFLAPLDVGVLLGVGPKTRERLHAAGIRTCAQLAEADADEWLRREARGIDDREVVTEWEPKSSGRETTFDEDVADPRVVLATIDDLAAEVQASLSGHRFRTIVVKLRYAGFETHTRRRTLDAPTADLEILRSTARELVRPFLGKRRIRLVGVTAAGLVPG